MTERADPLVGPHMTVREAVLTYPGIEAVFERHGLAGCGGSEGPIEPIAFFARVPEVDPAALLRDLNEFAARRTGAASLPLVEERPKQPFETYRLAIFTALALTLGGGLPLAVLVALGGGRDIGLGLRWAPLIQAHGHLQVVGFVGLFITGIAYHVLPRFKNTDLRLPGLALASVALLAGGVVLRAATQPWAESGLARALFPASAVIELAGALTFFAVVVTTLRGTAPKNYDRYLLVAAAWFVAAASGNVVAVAGVASDGFTTVASSRGTPLLEMYLFGFITLFILGVSIRVLPHFLSLRPPRVKFLTPALLLFNAALLARVGSGWLAAYSGWSNPEWLQTTAVYGMGAAVLLFVFALNLHRPAVRSADSLPALGHERLIRVAYVWLLVAFAIEAWYVSRGLAGDFGPDFLERGAARHALAVGFFTQMIFGVGARALPAFAGRSLYSPRLLGVTWVLINMAVLVRVGHAVVPAGSTTFRYDHIAASGAIAFLAVALFTYNIIRTVTPSRRRRA
ncbi:MAG TPA: NnrS family protein, partial [Dehalococcoidia bacterium]